MNYKNGQRRAGYDARNAQTDKDKLSRIICEKFISQEEYQNADTIMWYVHCRSEVQTQHALSQCLRSNKKIVVPYCTVNQQGEPCLGLWLLKDMRELIPATWGILEPDWKQGKTRLFALSDIELIMVPGVAFDSKGGRLGNGVGYYDRLLSQLSPETFLTGICFQSQIMDQIEMEPHDVPMHRVITETEVYQCNP